MPPLSEILHGWVFLRSWRKDAANPLIMLNADAASNLPALTGKSLSH